MAGDSSKQGSSRNVRPRQILTIAREILHSATGIPLVEITPASRIAEDLDLESIHLVELQVALEEEFDIELDPLDLIELGTIGQIADHVSAIIGIDPGRHGPASSFSRA